MQKAQSNQILFQFLKQTASTVNLREIAGMSNFEIIEEEKNMFYIILSFAFVFLDCLYADINIQICNFVGGSNKRTFI